MTPPVPLQFAWFLLALLVYASARKQKRVLNFIRRGGFLAEALSQPYILIYVFLAWVCFTTDWVYSFSDFMDFTSYLFEQDRPHAPGFCQAMREKICHAEACAGGICGSQELEDCTRRYPKPCMLLSIPHWLQTLVFLSPPCVILAVVISGVHTWRHARYGRPWCDRDLESLHAHAIEVILLPAVYGIFSLISVADQVSLLEGRTDTRVWKADATCDAEMQLHGKLQITDTCWSEFIDRSVRWCNLNFIVADLYEARALYCFSWACMEYIDLQRTKRGLLSSSCPTCHSAVSNMLLTPLKEMTLLGVQLFNVTNLARAVFALVAEQLRYAWISAFTWLSYKALQLGDVDAMLTGFNLCVSSIAIWNLIIFEHYLNNLLQGFSPKLKFWSAKIIVSLAFIQGLAVNIAGNLLPLDDYYQQHQRSLVYAALMCIEMLPVALLQYAAWTPSKIESIIRKGCPGSDAESKKLEFSIASGQQRMQITIEQATDQGVDFWHSASVTMLSSA